MFTRHGEVAEVGRLHYWVHTAYAFLEPFILKANDFMSRSRFFSTTPGGQGHLLVRSAHQRHASSRSRHSNRRGNTHHSRHRKILRRQGPHRSRTLRLPAHPGRYSEPVRKDMTVWYGAEIYKRFFDEEYDFVPPTTR